MHIGFCGPATLDSLQDLLEETVTIKGYPFRGSSILIREYLRLGHQVTLFTSSPDILHVTTYAGPNLKVIAVPTRARGPQRGFDFFAKERRYLAGEIERERPDVLHAHWTYEFGIAARESSIPSLLTVHDWAPKVARQNRHPYWYFRWAMQIRCLLYPGALSAPSNYIARSVIRTFRKSCIVIPNGIDISSFQMHSQDDNNSILRVGMLNVGFSRLKNVQNALAAWRRIKMEQTSAVLVAAGPGYELGGEAHQWAIDNDLDTDVEFVGPIQSDEVPSWLSHLDIFLHPSLEESFGMVLIEAMAAGVPVIAGSTSGAVPAITGGKALLVDVSSTGDLSNALSLAISDHTLRDSLSSAGLEWSKQFDVQESAKRFVSVLTTIATVR